MSMLWVWYKKICCFFAGPLLRLASVPSGVSSLFAPIILIVLLFLLSSSCFFIRGSLVRVCYLCMHVYLCFACVFCECVWFSTKTTNLKKHEWWCLFYLRIFLWLLFFIDLSVDHAYFFSSSSAWPSCALRRGCACEDRREEAARVHHRHPREDSHSGQGNRNGRGQLPVRA